MRSSVDGDGCCAKGGGGRYAAERDRLNQAKWRCPYSANTSAQYTKKSTDLQNFSYRRVSLHCERDWIEENS